MKKLASILALFAIAIGLRAEVLPYPTDTVNGKVVYRYTVEKSVGLYRISKMFDCSQEEIIDLNPQLKERGLHFEEVIFVPFKATIVAPQPTPEVPAPSIEKMQDPVVVETSVEPETPIVQTDTIAPSDTLTSATEEVKQFDNALRIALLLPLQAGAVERNTMMDRFFDFYEGALLAINDIQASGTAIELTVLDIDKGNAKVDKLLKDNALQGMHGILGPAYPTQVARVAPYVVEHQIPCLIPFTDNVEGIESNPYLMQFNVPGEEEALAMAEWLAARKDSVNCILIEGREADIPESIQDLRNAIRIKGVPTSTISVKNILNDSLGLVLRDSVENFILFNTERYSNLSMMMPHVLNCKGNHHLTLISQYSWQNEKILLPQIFTTEFATELPTDTRHYEEEFARWFNTERSSTYPRYDLLGYDLMRQLIAHLQGQEYFGLQSDIRMQKVGESGGWKNTNVVVKRKE